MLDREKNKTVLRILCSLMALFFLFRFWHLFIATTFMAIIFAILLFVTKPKQENKKEDAASYAENSGSIYNDISKQITEQVRMEYPNAKWVFNHPNSVSALQSGETVQIILNGAGGYRKADVRLKDGIIETEYVTNQKDNVNIPEGTAEQREVSEDYGLMAFEWVESHIDELNEKLNGIISEKKNEYIISSDELPDAESLESVCEELKRQGLDQVEIVPEGIKIIIK